MIIVIIPAKGGSTRLPNKNMHLLLGKPMLQYAIDYSKQSKRISKIYVSTDDDQIAHISKTAGAKIIKRPSELATDTSTTESAIKHALNNIDKRPDIIVLLQPTSPLRPEKSLDKALEKFIEKEYDSLLSISPTHRFFWSIENDKTIPSSIIIALIDIKGLN